MLLGESYHFCGWTWLVRLTRKVYTYNTYPTILASQLCCETRCISFFLPPANLVLVFVFKDEMSFLCLSFTNPTNHERMLTYIIPSSFLSVSVFSGFLSFFFSPKFQPLFEESRIRTYFYPESSTDDGIQSWPDSDIWFRTSHKKRARIQSVTLVVEIQRVFLGESTYTRIDCLWRFLVSDVHTYFLFGGEKV